jgi:glycosyltransferase involved in cell wall biosynthesis
MKSAFCTTAVIKPQGHGGGSSSYYELAALRNCTEVEQIIQPEGMVGRYPDNPFMDDYSTSLLAKPTEVAFTNGAPWSATVRVLNPRILFADSPAHNLKESVAEFQKMMGRYPFKHMIDPRLWEMYRQSFNRADIIFTEAYQSIGYLRDTGITAPCVVVPGGCHLPPIEKIKPLPETFRVGYIGALGPDKGVGYLINAWIALGFKDAELVLACDDPASLMKSLEPFRGKANFRFMGRMEDVGDFFNYISVLVQPSVTEGFGLTPLEAMSYERPVVVSRGAGIWEILEDGVDSILFEPRDVQSLCGILEVLKNNPDEAMGKAGRKKAEQYTWDRIQKDYEKAIREVIG